MVVHEIEVDEDLGLDCPLLDCENVVLLVVNDEYRAVAIRANGACNAPGRKIDEFL